jgi:RNA polymerase sigma-70 factor (ECF subfamily)
LSRRPLPLTSFPLAEPEDRTVEDVPDEILVSLAIDGDRDAFDRLARRHRHLAFRAAALIVGREQAEDVVQDALLLAFRTLATLRERAKFPRWLATIARFRALRMSQDERRYRARTVQLDSLPLATLSDLACAPRETGIGDDVLRPALARIPPNYAEVIRLHYFHGFPHQKIAAFLAVPVATIRWRCFRGKELLRNVLQPGGSAATCLDKACRSCPGAAACEGRRKAKRDMKKKKRTFRLTAGPALILALAGPAWAADEKATYRRPTAAVEVAPIGRGVTATWSVRLQADGDWLQVIEETIVLRASDPLRAVANDRPFEIRLPPEAEVVAGAMQTAGGQAVKVKPVPGDRKGDHYFPGPLPPGETRFAVGYRLPYRGQALIRPGIPYPLKRIVVVLPDSMTFEAESAGLFEKKPDANRALVRETASPKPGQSVAFRVSGTGTLARVPIPRKQQAGRTVSSHSGQTGQTASSHGGTSAPEGLPVAARPDHRFLAGGLIAVLLAGSAVLFGYKRKHLRRLSA